MIQHVLYLYHSGSKGSSSRSSKGQSSVKDRGGDQSQGCSNKPGDDDDNDKQDEPGQGNQRGKGREMEEMMKGRIKMTETMMMKRRKRRELRCIEVSRDLTWVTGWIVMPLNKIRTLKEQYHSSPSFTFQIPQPLSLGCMAFKPS